MGAGDVEQPGGRNPGMVPGTERRIFRTAGYPAHVGRSIGCGRLLALLDVARIPPAFGFRLRFGAAGHGRACVLDGISRRPTIARRKSSHGRDAASAAKVDWTLVWPPNSTSIESC